MTTGADIIEFARSKIGQYYYTNDLDLRANPEVSGGTDCSGFVNYVYRTLTGIDVGSWTGAQSSAGWEIVRGEWPYQIPWEQLQPGDLILMTANHPGNYVFNAYDCHVELYCGGGTMIGHPGGYGPQEKRAQAWMESYGCSTWMVRRVLADGGVSGNTRPVGIKPMRFAVYTSGWLPEGQEGDGSPIRYIAMDFPGWYQVCTEQSGWLPVVYKFDEMDFSQGCAGDGSPITAVRAYMETPNPAVNGWHAVKYAVSVGHGYMPAMIDLRDTGGSGDDFAGNFTPITEFTAEIVRV